MFNLNKFTSMVKSMLTGQDGVAETAATIIPTNDGKFGIFTRNGIVGTYSRERDAIRGATRRGLDLA